MFVRTRTKSTRRWPSSLGGRLLGYLSRLSVERFLKPCCVGLRRSLTHGGGVRHLLSENPLRYELVADRQRWLGACYNRAIYTQIASRLWRDTLAIGVVPLQLARFIAKEQKETAARQAPPGEKKLEEVVSPLSGSRSGQEKPLATTASFSTATMRHQPRSAR